MSTRRIQSNDDDDNDDDQFDLDENNEQDMLMMDTFFKRVDSCDLNQKPNKAKIINNYLIGELLGDGSYGKVKECLHLSSLSRRAVKIINLKMISRKIPRGVENVRKEINIMKRLNHKNLIKLYDTFEKSGGQQQQQETTTTTADELLATSAKMINLDKPPKLYIFMDYCMTSLEKLLKNAPDQRLCNWQAQHYMKQLMNGLDYLHSINIIHNDIKPGNLLINCDDILKICDFSISAELNLFYEYEYIMNNNKVQQNDNYDDDNEINPNLLLAHNNVNRNRFPIIQSTPMFQCPEMLEEQIDELQVLKNAPKIDIWSSGVTLYQLTTGKLPFSGNTVHQIFENIRSNSHQIEIPISDKNLNYLLVNMLHRDPSRRWSIQQIRDSEWFRKKHPIVKEDLAQLPNDVLQNEFQTFRMLNYLEKLCQSTTTTTNTNTNIEQQQLILNINHNNNISSNSGCCFNDQQNNEEEEEQQQASQATNNNNGNLIFNKSSQQQQQIKQATKLKRNHCVLM